MDNKKRETCEEGAPAFMVASRIRGERNEFTERLAARTVEAGTPGTSSG